MGWTDEASGKVVRIVERSDGVTQYFVSDVVPEVCVFVSTTTRTEGTDVYLLRVRSLPLRFGHAYGVSSVG